MEPQCIHEDLAQALVDSEKLREESDRRCEEAEREVSRLRKLLEEGTGAVE
jgi:hypothetical protein